MRKLSEIERIKVQTVRDYLSRYELAVENMKGLEELNAHIYQNKNNPSIGGKGYRTGSSCNALSSGAAAPCINSDSMQEYIKIQSERNTAIMKECENAIALLDVSRGKTLLERRFLLLQSWRKIQIEFNICRTTCIKYSRETMIILFDRMVIAGMIKPL